jgi:hypothetical protein
MKKAGLFLTRNKVNASGKCPVRFQLPTRNEEKNSILDYSSIQNIGIGKSRKYEKIPNTPNTQTPN